MAVFTTVVFLLMLKFYYQNFLFQLPIRNLPLIIVAFLLVLLVGYGLTRISTDDKKLNALILITMIAIFMIIATYWITVVPNLQVSDYGNFWSRAFNYEVGNPLYQDDNDYFSKYAYQTGFFVYVVGVVKIFGYHIFVIQFLNVIYQALILYVTYLTVNKVFHNIRMARLAVLLLMIDLDWFALNAQTSNQYLGSLMFLLTFYLLMLDKTKYYLLAGVTLALGCIVKPIGPVVVAGIIVFGLLIKLWKQHNYQSSLKILATLAIYFLLFSLAGWGIKASGINEYGLSNRDSEWKFVTGLNYDSNGAYSPDLNRFIDPSKSRNEMNNVEKAQVKRERTFLNQHHSWLRLFVNKTQLLWSSRTMATDSTNFNLNHSQKTFDLVNYSAYIGSIILIIFSWIGSLELFKTKFSDNLYLLLLPLMALAVVQLLIEVQGRYRIEFLPVIAIIGSLGLYKSIELIRSFAPKEKESLNLE